MFWSVLGKYCLRIKIRWHQWSPQLRRRQKSELRQTERAQAQLLRKVFFCILNTNSISRIDYRYWFDSLRQCNALAGLRYLLLPKGVYVLYDRAVAYIISLSRIECLVPSAMSLGSFFVEANNACNIKGNSRATPLHGPYRALNSLSFRSLARPRFLQGTREFRTTA